MPYLIPLKPSCDAARRVEARVNKYCVVNTDQNKYSVPDYLAGKFVNAKVYPAIIEIYYKTNKVTEHKRAYKSHYWTVDINHFIHTLKKNPEYYTQVSADTSLAPSFKKCIKNNILIIHKIS